MAVLHHGRTEPPDTEACPAQPATARRDQPPTALPEQSLTACRDQPPTVLSEQSPTACRDQPPTARPEPYATARPKQPRATVPEQSSAALPQRPPTALPAAPRARRPLKRLLALAVVLLLAAVLLSVAHQIRPAPYGDRLTPGPPAHTARARGDVVEAYDGRTLRWRYARVGRRPLSVLPALGHAFTVWDDGLVTDTDGRSVRWHRALPAAVGWLRTRGGAGVLRPLGRGILAIVTPARIAAYRTADGDLRWVLPARAGCAFRPERAVRHGPALLVAQPCAHGAWTAQLVAVDDLGGIAPHRTPLGNERPGAGRPEHPRTEKALAPPR
ncbi:hypothetical protein ABT404_30430 [Streptomyces hyaluromycini]|uniref:Uncharacterized protein n=1 Tax=Streptomyces hyaluromycini TaxID=1377993 RepID=A0ABV1X3Z4_9ACTN